MRVAVFASGGGSNLQCLLERLNGAKSWVARIELVVSDRIDAGALSRARKVGVRARTIPVSGRTQEDVAVETIEVLEEASIDLIALAGYLHLVPRQIVERWRGRILNIHPALLPAFGGKGMYGRHVHRAVLESGCMVTGATAHLVDERYDEGKPLLQWPVPVLRGDTVETLAARVLQIEHVLYPLAVETAARAIAAGRDVSEMMQMAWGARAWGFDADSGAFKWDENGMPPGAELGQLMGIEPEEEGS
ncbi:MAG: phosphoribosylglycinamide formyltransferase [Longimicrobiales bacterium]